MLSTKSDKNFLYHTTDIMVCTSIKKSNETSNKNDFLIGGNLIVGYQQKKSVEHANEATSSSLFFLESASRDTSGYFLVVTFICQLVLGRKLVVDKSDNWEREGGVVQVVLILSSLWPTLYCPEKRRQLRGGVVISQLINLCSQSS